MPRAAPYVISPTAAALASFVKRTGRPMRSDIKSAKGITFIPPKVRFTAFSIVPV